MLDGWSNGKWKCSECGIVISHSIYGKDIAPFGEVSDHLQDHAEQWMEQQKRKKMKQISTDIAAFMSKFQQAIDGNVVQVDAAADRLLSELGRYLIHDAKKWYKIGNEKKSIKAFRAALMIEELGEMLQALGDGNDVELLDATLDQIFVGVGTALAFGITTEQLQKGWDAVQASNMSKSFDPVNQKIRKGKAYFPVDLISILRSNEDDS